MTLRSDLMTDLENTIRDEAYDGALGALSEEQFARMCRRIAEAAREVVEAAHAPTGAEREAQRIAELDARQAAYRKDREDWFVDHESAPEIASDAFFRGWDAAVAAGFRRSEVPEPSVQEWALRAIAAREKAIAKGYTPEHDAEHGIRHLLDWAIDYARRGRAEESSGLILSAKALLDAGPQGEPSAAQTLETFLRKLAGDGAYALDFSSADALHGHIVHLLKRDIAALRTAGEVGHG